MTANEVILHTRILSPELLANVTRHGLLVITVRMLQTSLIQKKRIKTGNVWKMGNTYYVVLYNGILFITGVATDMCM